MKPDEKEIDGFAKALRSRHALRFDELVKQAEKLAIYIKALDDFKFVQTDPLLDIPHVGRVIVDAVLQVAHDYEKQVRSRVEKIITHPEASTISGFLHLMREQGISKLLDWNSDLTEKDMLSVGTFFANRGIETYSELKECLKSEENRESLMSERSGLGGNGTFRVADKTADYFRLLVCHWDAVAVDSNIKAILKNAAITSNYSYTEMRAVFQLAALDMSVRPIDLDASVYYDSVAHPERYKQAREPKRPRVGQSSYKRTKEGGSVVTGPMPKKGDIFEGKVNDLRLKKDDTDGWKRRDIWFFKHETNRREKFGYPTRNDQITLIDTDGYRYEMNFSKPDLEDKVCLGTPSRLKPWYRQKGFDDQVISPNDRVYFEYTGHGTEFIILTELEYRSRHNR